MNFYGSGYGSGYDYSYSSGVSTVVLTVLAIVLSLAATILLFILVIPEKKRAKLPKFFQVIHDICNFKGLLIEKLLKVFYVFSTVYIMFNGVLTWFSGGNFGINFLTGLLMLVLGPILIRIVYEALMLGILLVKNVIQINNKLSGKSEDPFNNQNGAFGSFSSNNQQNANQVNDTYQQPQVNYDNQNYYNQPQNDQQPQQEYVAPTSSKFCTFCGAQIDGNISVCPHCGNTNV